MKTLEEYKDEGDIKTGSSNPAQARSLNKQAQERIDDLEEQSINKKNARFRFEDAYEALRESLQSFMALKGLKPYSHEATIVYAKEKGLLNEKQANTTDRYRKIRKDIVYRAEEVNTEETKEAIRFTREQVDRLTIEFEKLL